MCTDLNMLQSSCTASHASEHSTATSRSSLCCTRFPQKVVGTYSWDGLTTSPEQDYPIYTLSYRFLSPCRGFPSKVRAPARSLRVLCCASMTLTGTAKERCCSTVVVGQPCRSACSTPVSCMLRLCASEAESDECGDTYFARRGSVVFLLTD
jgi:hypothetical protein